MNIVLATDWTTEGPKNQAVSFLHIIQASSVALLVSYTMAMGTFSQGVKQLGS
jgi:hypothetical protein